MNGGKGLGPTHEFDCITNVNFAFIKQSRFAEGNKAGIAF